MKHQHPLTLIVAWCHLRDTALGTLLSLRLRCGLTPDRGAAIHHRHLEP